MAAVLEPAGGAPPPGTRRLRLIAALALLGAAGAVLLVLLGASLAGGGTVELLGREVTVTSWRPTRLALALLAAALLADPDRRRWLVAWRWLEARWSRAVWVGLGLLTAYVVAYKTRQYLAFELTAYDLTLFESTLHHTLNGRFMHAWGLERTLFSEHFEPVMLLILPIYAVLRGSLTLVVLEGLGVVAACVPLYAAARAEALSRPLAALVVVAFFWNRVFWQGLQVDFHVELFTPLALFTMYWAVVARRWRAFYPALAFLLLIKEELALVGAPFALLMLWHDRRQWRHAAATAALSLLWGVLAFKVVIPLTHPAPSAENPLLWRWGHLGGSFSEIATALLTRPGYVLSTLVAAPSRDAALTVGFLPLVDPISLLAALPALLLHVTSGMAFEARLGGYYGVIATSVLFLSVPRVLGRLSRAGRPALAALAGALVIACNSGPRFLPAPTAADRAAGEVIRALPAGASVCAQTVFVPRLDFSEAVAMYPDCPPAPRFILLGPGRFPWPLTDEEYAAAVAGLLGGGEYGVTRVEDRLLLLERGAATTRNAEVARALALPAGGGGGL